MKNFLILIIILISSSVFADVYLKTVYEPTTTVLLPKDPIINLCPGDNDSWNTLLRKCVCDEEFKESPFGCIDDPCYGYSCGNDGVCETELISDRTFYPNPATFHYEASCTCPEDYVEFNLECILNPCLDYDCYEYGYCEAVEDQCECKEGYVKYTGELLYHPSLPYYTTPAEDVLTCIGTEKVWDWTVSDKECENNDENVWYAFYSNEKYEEIPPDLHCNDIYNCRCIISPFNQPSMDNTDLNKPPFYSKENGWVLLHKDFGYPKYEVNGEDNILGDSNVHVIQPRFILYNKYTGALKTFIYLREHDAPKSYGFLSIIHKKNDDLKSMIFNNVFNKSFSEGYYQSLATNSIDIVGEFETKTIVPHLPGLYKKELWFYSDFVADYDSNTKNIKDSLIDFELIAIDEEKLNGEVFGTLNERVDNGSSSSSINMGDVFSKLKTAKGYYKDFDAIANKYIPEEEWASSSVNGVAVLINTTAGIGASTWLTSAIRGSVPLLGAAFAFADYFFGSKERPHPTIFDANLKIDITGIHKYHLEGFSFKTPGTTYEKNSDIIYYPVYDKPLGVVTLLSPPVVRYQEYHSCYKSNPYHPYDCMGQIDYRDSCLGVEKYGQSIYSCPSDPFSMPGQDPKYDLYNYYKLTKLPKIEVNPDSGLELISTNVSIIGEVDFMNEYGELENHWNEIREAGGRDIIYSYKLGEDVIQNQETGEITSIISKYSTRVLPYDIAENELSFVFPKEADVSIKVTYIFKTKNTEKIDETFFIVKTYRPDFIEFEENITNPEELNVSEIQKYGNPVGNILIKDLYGNVIDKPLKKGQEIDLSYNRVVNNLTSPSNTSILFPTFPINILYNESDPNILLPPNPVDLLFSEGDNFSWDINAEKDYYNLFEELGVEDCINLDTRLNCKFKHSLEENKENDVRVYNISRSFIVPTNTLIGKHLLFIPVKYYIYMKDELSESGYRAEERLYIYKKEIEVTE